MKQTPEEIKQTEGQAGNKPTMESEPDKQAVKDDTSVKNQVAENIPGEQPAKGDTTTEKQATESEPEKEPVKSNTPTEKQAADSEPDEQAVKSETSTEKQAAKDDAPTEKQAEKERPKGGRQTAPGIQDPRKASPKEDLKIEDSLELATMSRKERRAVKKNRYKETTSGMTKTQKFQYFLYAYKMEILLPFMVLICVGLIAFAFLRNRRPVALSYAVVNCEDLDVLDTSAIDEDYMNYYGFDNKYQLSSVLDLNYDLNTSSSETVKDGESGNYIAFPTLCRENYYDVIITNRAGLEYLSYNSIIYPIDEALSADLYSLFSAEYKDRFSSSFDYTGKSMSYAIDISDTDFAKSLNTGYDDIYICFPGNSEDNQTNVKRLCKFIFNLDIDV